jgi:hypothetical protein
MIDADGEIAGPWCLTSSRRICIMVARSGYLAPQHFEKRGISVSNFSFKFHWVDDNGQPAGFLAKKGLVDGDTITLDDAQIPIAAIAASDVRGQYLVLSVAKEGGTVADIVVHTGKAKQVKEVLGRLRSAIWADMHREELEAKGQGHTFRQQTCPACGATLDLTGMDDTPQISCNFCHTVSTLRSPEGDPITEVERGCRLCDQCGMYSIPRQFTIVYFYFLLVVYGWRSQTTWRCPGCMRGEAWKMLFGNLIFVLGVPTALIQLFRSYGGTSIGGLYPGLDGANLRASKGNLTGAIEAYQKILERRPISAGVKFNIGRAFAMEDELAQAAKMFEFSLADCSNYQPAAAALAACYEELGETEKLADLKKRWDAEDEEDEQGETGHGADSARADGTGKGEEYTSG